MSMINWTARSQKAVQSDLGFTEDLAREGKLIQTVQATQRLRLVR